MSSIIDRLENHLSDYRKNHIYRVMLYADRLYMREADNPADTSEREKIAQAALIHDLTKEEPSSFHYHIFTEHNAPAEYHQMPVPVLHSKSAAFYAEDLFGIHDDQITEAVAYHTTGHPEMSRFARIIYAADYLGSRDEDEAEELVQAELDAICLEKAKKSLKSLIKKEKPVQADTFEFYNTLI